MSRGPCQIAPGMLFGHLPNPCGWGQPRGQPAQCVLGVVWAFPKFAPHPSGPTPCPKLKFHQICNTLRNPKPSTRARWATLPKCQRAVCNMPHPCMPPKMWGKPHVANVGVPPPQISNLVKFQMKFRSGPTPQATPRPKSVPSALVDSNPPRTTYKPRGAHLGWPTTPKPWSERLRGGYSRV